MSCQHFLTIVAVWTAEWIVVRDYNLLIPMHARARFNVEFLCLALEYLLEVCSRLIGAGQVLVDGMLCIIGRSAHLIEQIEHDLPEGIVLPCQGIYQELFLLFLESLGMLLDFFSALFFITAESFDFRFIAKDFAFGSIVTENPCCHLPNCRCLGKGTVVFQELSVLVFVVAANQVDVAFMLGDEIHDLSVLLATVHYIAHEDNGIGIYITAGLFQTGCQAFVVAVYIPDDEYAQSFFPSSPCPASCSVLSKLGFFVSMLTTSS